MEGSMGNSPVCSANTGMCQCKEYVEGQNCDVCKPGYFGMSAGNTLGCLACFCYGHSSDCSSARGYVAQFIQSDFSSGTQRWRAATRDNRQYIDLRYDSIAQNIGVSSPNNEAVYFVAPGACLRACVRVWRWCFWLPVVFYSVRGLLTCFHLTV